MSYQMMLCLCLSVFVIAVYFRVVFKKSEIRRIGFWRRQIPFTVIVNAIGFTSIALLFYFSYGYITDDRTFFVRCLAYDGNLFNMKNGNDFMFYITKPLRLYFHLDLPSLHVLFGTMGFIGSMNFLFVLNKGVTFTDSREKGNNLIRLWTILCFPNIMVWGRIYGKDSTILFLASICVICCYYIFEKKRNIVFNLIVYIMTIFLISKIRIHIAAALAVGLLAGFYFLSIAKKEYSSFNQHILMKLIVPGIIIASFFAISPILIKKVTNRDTVSVDAMKTSLMDATRMGAYGGSATSLASEFKSDPTVVFSPRQIAENILNLLFAPLPWQVRGGLDMVALASNVLLLFLILKFVRRVDLNNVFQKYLLVTIISLIVLLSFLTGNVGLILRQKTILLAFLFLFLLRSKPFRFAVNRRNPQTLPPAPAPAIQA